MVIKKRIKRLIAKRKKPKTSSVRVKSAKPRRKVSGNNSSVSRKDFETFSFGVQRLKELKSELDSFDTMGFTREEQAIRIKLKKVSEIPNIEKAMKVLKSKINKKYKPRKRKSILKKDIRDIKEDIPELKTEIKRLGNKLEESKRRSSTRVDSGVGVLVDTDFNSFLTDIKSSLSGRIRNREKEIDEKLKNDLQKREEKFKRTYSELVREFNEKFDKKIKTSLNKKVSEDFNKQLKKKLDSEKVELGKRYKKELKEHSDKEFENQKKILKQKLDEQEQRDKDVLANQFNENLKQELVVKEKIIRQQLRNEFDLNLKKKMQEHENELKKRKLDLELEMQKKIKQVLN